MQKPRPPSFLMYSHDGFGLGHLKRNFTIAKRMVQLHPGSQALLIMGHHSVPFHPIPKGIDFFKLPSIIKVNDEQWLPRKLMMDADAFRAMRISLIKKVAEHFLPDIFLVDYVPKGVWGELMPVLAYFKERGTKTVLGLRDIIDDPQVTRNRWMQGGTYEVMQEFYDKILIYGDSELFDTANQYGMNEELKKKSTYCGYLCSEETPENPDIYRKELGLHQERLIVATAGGGGDAFPMMKLTLDALKLYHKNQTFKAILIAGPLMDPDKKNELVEQAVSFPIKVINSTDGILSLMNAADLLITMGSYNTLVEAVRLNRPTLVIPREGPSLEQQIRARLFSEKGFVKTLITPSSLQPQHLAEAIEYKLREIPVKKVQSLNMGGLSSAVKELSECLYTENFMIQRS